MAYSNGAKHTFLRAGRLLAIRVSGGQSSRRKAHSNRKSVNRPSHIPLYNPGRGTGPLERSSRRRRTRTKLSLLDDAIFHDRFTLAGRNEASPGRGSASYRKSGNAQHTFAHTQLTGVVVNKENVRHKTSTERTRYKSRGSVRQLAGYADCWCCDW
jgi:hypothetical protein